MAGDSGKESWVSSFVRVLRNATIIAGINLALSGGICWFVGWHKAEEFATAVGIGAIVIVLLGGAAPSSDTWFSSPMEELQTVYEDERRNIPAIVLTLLTGVISVLLAIVFGSVLLKLG